MTVISSNTSVALWTPQGRGAVATIRVCGDITPFSEGENRAVPFNAVNGKRLADQPLGRVVFGTWGREPSEDVVVCRVDNDVLEIHCHGGVAAARRIMTDWESLGIPPVSWQDQMAWSSGELTARCREAVSRATTLRTAGILLDQESAWQAFLKSAQEWAQSGDWKALRRSISDALTWQDVGRHLLDPFLVVLTGPPNVGKSALLNALVGYQRSVVFDQPGTTRDVVTAETAIDGWPVRLIDTAGLRDNAEGLEAAGIELTHQQLEHADLALRVSDVSQPSLRQPELVARQVPVICIANKIDLFDPQFVTEHFADAIGVSARTGAGVDLLCRQIGERLLTRVPERGALVPFCEDQVNWLMTLQAAVDAEVANEVEAILAEGIS